MKIILCFVFLGFALVLSHQDVQKRSTKRSVLPCVGGNNQALLNLLGDGKPIANKLIPSTDCRTDMARTNIVIKNVRNEITGIRLDFQTTCYVVGLSNMVVHLYAKEETGRVAPGSKQCANIPTFQAVFLNQDPNTNTYMILKPDKAPWFFTLGLGGCDIFVATSHNPDQRNKPIVIHSNLNDCGIKLQNLQKKGETVDELLQSHPNYRLIARVYNKPPPTDEQTSRYLQQYEANHRGIKLVSYDTSTRQAFQFIGHYDQSWTFILKGEVDGIILTQITLM